MAFFSTLLNAHELLAQVIEGVRFVDGEIKEEAA